MNISELQQDVAGFSKERGFDQSSMESRMVYLVSEVGEVAKEVLHLMHNPEPDQREVIKDRLGMEMYDVVWNLLELANKLDIDLESAFKKKININRDRVWS